jgi:hypothetical protein
MILNPDIFRCWIGNATNEDGVLRGVIRHQCNDTGADLLTDDESRRVKMMLDGRYPTPGIARAMVEILRKRVLESGAVVARPSAGGIGGVVYPFERQGWIKQGHAAACAIILHAGGRPELADRVIRWLMEQQEQGVELRVPGLFMAGDRFASWHGSWSWVHHVYPFEDATQVACACALHAFDRTAHFRLAVDGMRSVLHRNEVGLVPYCASTRSGLPEWGRSVSPAAYACEESARVGMLLAAAGHEDDARLIRDTLAMHRLASGAWPRFIDAQMLLPVYPRADPNDPMRGVGLGELTRERSESVGSGFDTDTVTPAMLEALPLFQQVNP